MSDRDKIALEKFGHIEKDLTTTMECKKCQWVFGSHYGLICPSLTRQETRELHERDRKTKKEKAKEK